MRMPNKNCDICSNWMAAQILCFHFINGAVGISGISVVNIAFIAVLLFVSLPAKYFLEKKHIYILVVCVILMFVISFCRVPNLMYTISYMGYFLAFGVISLLVGAMKVDVECVVKNILYIGIVGFCFYLIRGFEGMDSSTTMGITYSMCPILFSAIISLINYKNKKLVAGLCVILSLYIFIHHAPRGVWLITAVFVFFSCFYKAVQSKSNCVANTKKFAIIIALLILLYLLINNLIELVTWADSFTNNTFNVSISALKKILFYSKKGDLLNGRNSLWSTAFTYISESPFFGKGIGYFECENAGAYPHNLILQAMCENGALFGGIAFLLLMIKSLTILFTTNKSVSFDRYCYSVMIITVGIVMLFYSSSYWLWVPFWYNVGYLMSDNVNHLKNYVREL